jgi:hypothetical protein
MVPVKFLLPYLFLIFFWLITAARADAQSMYNTSHISFGPREYASDYGIAISTGIEDPLSLARRQLRGIYNDAPYLTFGFLRFWDSFCFNLSGSYRSFKEKQQGYPFKFSDENYGTYTYHDFSTYSVYAGVIYNYDLEKNVKIFAGFNAGKYYTKYGLALGNSKANFDLPLTDKGTLIAPTGGFDLKMARNFKLRLQATYNKFNTSLSIVNAAGATKSYGTVATGASVVFRFD